MAVFAISLPSFSGFTAEFGDASTRFTSARRWFGRPSPPAAIAQDRYGSSVLVSEFDTAAIADLERRRLPIESPRRLILHKPANSASRVGGLVIVTVH